MLNTEFPSINVEVGNDYPEIREGVRAICQEFPSEYWRKVEDADEYPTEFVSAFTEAGFLAALVPEEYGGSGLPLRAGGIILEELSAAGGDTACCHAQMYMMAVIHRHGTESQKDQYLPGIAAGRIRYQAFGVTEPTTGSDTLNLKTRAEKNGDHYIVNGQKVWTSRAGHSDLMTLLVRTTPIDQVKTRTEGLSVLLVDLNEAVGNGMTIQPIDAMIHHHTNEVFFDNLKVPAENLIGEEGLGFRYILSGMNAERILLSHGSLGDARFFIDKAVSYAGDRVVFGRSIGQNQGIQFPIARSYAEWRSADLMTRTAAAKFERGENCGEEANLARLLSADAAWNAGDAAMQTFGGFGLAREYDIERKWRSARLYKIAPISTNLILSYIGHNVLGLPKSY